MIESYKIMSGKEEAGVFKGSQSKKHNKNQLVFYTQQAVDPRSYLSEDFCMLNIYTGSRGNWAST